MKNIDRAPLIRGKNNNDDCTCTEEVVQKVFLHNSLKHFLNIEKEEQVFTEHTPKWKRQI